MRPTAKPIRGTPRGRFVPSRDERRERRRKMIFLAVAVFIVVLFLIQVFYPALSGQ